MAITLPWAWLHQQEERAGMDYNKTQSAYAVTGVLTCSNSLIKTQQFFLYIGFWLFSPGSPLLCCEIFCANSLVFPAICCFPLIVLFHVDVYQKPILNFQRKSLKCKVEKITRVEGQWLDLLPSTLLEGDVMNCKHHEWHSDWKS